jgi:predicted DNA-binding protein (MmcQ/YjbR family)
MKQEDVSDETINALRHLVQKGIATVEFEKETQKLPEYPKTHLGKLDDGAYELLKGKALENWAKNLLKIVNAGAKAGRLRDPELFLLRVYPIERVHEERFMDSTRLNAVNQKLDAICKEHGLEDGESWLIGEGPDEWEAANVEFDAISNELFIEALVEFGAQDLADLLKNNPEEFERYREISRLSIFQPSETLTNTLDGIRKQFLKESEICAQSEAYYAACVMLGATLEATMLALCYKNKEDAVSTANKLPSKIRPRPGSEPAQWTFAQLVHVAHAAGWLPNPQIDDYELHTKELIDLARQLRNSIHPGKHISSELRIRIAEQDYLDAKAIYQVVKNYIILPLLESA